MDPASSEPRVWEPRRVQVGEWRVTALSDGHFRLDGGAMWGVVPAPLWRAFTPPAADNTILLALNCFLAERGDARVVIEGGIGSRWDAKLRSIYQIDPTASLAGCLAVCGLAVEDVTHVVATHCHWDHIGALVALQDGALAPLFPRARHFAPAVEVVRAQDPGDVRRASYRVDDVRPLLDAGLLETYTGEVELLPGLRVHELGGHSEGVSVVTLESAGETAVFWSDVVPTTHHVQPPYIMAYDVDVARSFEVRSEWLARAADGAWLGLFYHDPDVPFARLTRAGGRYAVAAVPGELVLAGEA
jgi:glyoxylase-like metal-dependent hydrolase (beta-lactamase superfamily II)